MRHLAVRNWHKFQHYKDRSPVWIKLYTELLDSPEWLALSDVARAHLVGLWLLASKRGNVLPTSATTLRALIGASSPVRLQELLAGGWVEYAEPSASDPASNTASKVASKSASKTASEPASAAASTSASPHARPRARVEGETEREKEEQQPSSTGARVLRVVGDDPPPDPVGVFLNALPPTRRLAWQQTLDGWRQGVGYIAGRPAADADIAQGVTEYLASSPTPDFAPAHVVQFVRRAEERRTKPPKAEKPTSFWEVA